MTARDPPPHMAADPVSGLQDLARDWITLWQSELAAAAVDREAQEAWHSWLALWAGAAGAMVKAMPRGLHNGAWPDGGPPIRPGTAAPARPAAAAAAPDPRDAEIDRLARLVGELERRLDELESRSR